MSLLLIAATSSAFAGQPTSIVDLAKTSRKATAVEMETRGSGPTLTALKNAATNTLNSASNLAAKGIVKVVVAAKNVTAKATCVAVNYVAGPNACKIK